MHLLYLDESGDEGRGIRSDPHFILSGLAIHESRWYTVSTAVTRALEQALGTSNIELHANPLMQGKAAPYRKFSYKLREQAYRDVLETLGRKAAQLSIFTVVVSKPDVAVTRSIRLVAVWEICRNFNAFLERVSEYSGDAYGRGMIVLDATNESRRIKDLVDAIHDAGLPGHKRLRIVETAFFAKSDDSRLLQAADLVCHTTMQLVRNRSNTHFATVERKIDRFVVPGAKRCVHYGFRYIAKNPPSTTLPFRYLDMDPETGLPYGSFLNITDLERDLSNAGL